VLVVDDEIIVRKTARALLEDLGFEVEEAVNGEEAIAAVAGASHPFDVVLLDATMPGLDAHQTLCGIRAVSSTLPILLCSGYSRLDFCDELESDTHLDFLAKPFRVKELTSKIEDMIDAPSS
jgi:two-component system cell cycle sensor histidine kinase/response regulator CckA